MPTLLSPTPSTSTTSNVSASPPNFIGQFVSALGKKFDESQKLTHDLFIGMDDPLQILDNSKKVADHNYSTKTLNTSSSAVPTSAPLYGMPPNYFVGQRPLLGTVWPPLAELVRPAALAG